MKFTIPMRYFSILTVAVMLLFSSCVSLKKYQKMSADLDQCKTNRSSLEKQVKELTDLANQCGSSLNNLKQEVRQLKLDTAQYGEAQRSIEANFNLMSQQMRDLKSNSEQKNKMTDKEMKGLLAEIQKNQESLFQKQDSVNKLIEALNEKQKNLFMAQANLRDKERRVKELESVLNERDSVVKALRKTVNDALVGFVGNGLSVNIRNGQVYVSLEESLLFKTASWQVSPNGTEALKKLAKVLEKQTEINVMVEGHTDNVTFNGPGQVRDNWDLSVMRATSVTKLLLQNGEINPVRITPAGRGEYFPIDATNSMEARAKNRRTEIILTPKLDQLLKLIGNEK